MPPPTIATSYVTGAAFAAEEPGSGAKAPAPPIAPKGMTVATTHERLAPFANEPIRTFTDPADRSSLEAAIARAQDAGGALLSRSSSTAGASTASRGSSRTIRRIRRRRSAASRRRRPSRRTKRSMRRPARSSLGSASRRRNAPDFLLRAADLIRARRDDFNALLVLEVGKSWIEADGDTAEAIDFLEFYAREALRYADPPTLTPVAGEENRLEYIPLGVGRRDSAVELRLCDHGRHDDRGDRRRQHGRAEAVERFAGHRGGVRRPAASRSACRRASSTSFPGRAARSATRSSPTRRRASSRSPARRKSACTSTSSPPRRSPVRLWIKRVVAEMGGKDSIVVADDADLDAAAEGVAASAFGFQGQKCSACSRAIVDQRVYDEFVDKLVERVNDDRRRRSGGRAGPTSGPVINEGAMKHDPRLHREGRRRGRPTADRR